MSLDYYTRVTLNSDSTGSFYTGDIVTGTIVLELQKDQKIESISLEVVGISKASWTRSSPTVPYIKIYSEKKRIFYTKIENLFGNFINDKNKIKAGIYSHPFHFALPQDLPSTFKTSIACVNYCIKIKSQPSCKLRKVVPFNVLGNVNLNHLDEMLESTVYEFTKSFATTEAVVAVSIKTYKGIAPRQVIPVKFIINNQKRVKIRKVKVALVQKLYYNVSTGYADEDVQICKAEYTEISNSVAETCDIKMEVPQVVPSTVYMSDPMISVSYVLKIEIIFAFHSNFQEEIPIAVASFPVIHNDLPL